MQRALALSLRGQGLVEPNPMVGCVIVRDGRIVGEGWHKKFGGPHAEVHALKAAGNQAKGATAYVTLEPCCHFGKTPPCTDALINAGVARVVAAVKDPNPLVAGKGLAKLRKAGIRVETGLLAADASEVLAPFITYQTLCRPYVILKWAQSIDGKIATRTGESKWISSEQSRRAAHALRARVDGVIVGLGTVQADNPDLTARLAPPKRVATRIVLDRQARTPLKSRLVATARQTPVLIVCGSPRADEVSRVRRRAAALQRAGCQVIMLPIVEDRLDLPALMRELHGRGMTNVMVEGGGQTLGSFLDQGLADEALIFVAPRLIGGAGAPSPLSGVGPARMSEIPAVSHSKVSPSGPDLCYQIRFKPSIRK